MLWRLLFPIVFIYTFIDGFIVNMTYPAKLPFLYRDFLILITYFFFMIEEHLWRTIRDVRKRFGRVAWYSAMAFLLVGAIQIFNPASPSLVRGLLGFKVMFFYWPLALLGYVYVNRHENLVNFMRMIAYVSVPINIFGLVQFVKGP